MVTEIIEILQKKYPEYCMQHHDTAWEIYSLMGENELDASDATEVKNDAYADVRNLECEADEPIDSEQTSSAALETRIDSEKTCEHEWNMNMLAGGGMTITCMKCGIDRSQV